MGFTLLSRSTRPLWAGAAKDSIAGLTEQAGEQRYEDHTDEGHTAARHHLLHALAFRTRVVIAIAFQEVNGAPDTQASAQGNHEGLENFDCAIEKIHIVVAGTYGSSKKMVLRIAKAGMKTACAAPDSGISFQFLMVVLHPDFAK